MRTLDVYLIGARHRESDGGQSHKNNIGYNVLALLLAESARLREQYDLQLRVCGIARTERMLLRTNGVALVRWEADFPQYARETDLPMFFADAAAKGQNAVVVDCSASPTLPEYYPQILASNHLVLANKHGPSDPGHYAAMHRAAHQSGRGLRYATTVGAGLPVIDHVRDIAQSSYEGSIEIDAVPSGTMSKIFGGSDDGTAFSALTQEAQVLGFTEPDPRSDLNGADAGKKTAILALEAGAQLRPGQIAVQSMVPADCEDVPREQFIAKLALHDGAFELHRRQAIDRGKRLRYIARLLLEKRDGRTVLQEGTVGLREVDENHPAVGLQPGHNIFVITTSRLRSVIEGKGAGADVTSASVLNDILRVAK